MLRLLAEGALRSLVLGASVALVLKLLRVRNPHTQMTAWTVVLIAALSMPALIGRLTLALPPGSWPLRLLDEVGATMARLREFPFADDRGAPAALAYGADHSLPDAITATTSHWTIDGWVFATCLYGFVAGVFLARLLTGLLLGWRLVQAAMRVDESWAGGADVRISDAVGMPVTFGSTILLPSDCGEWSIAKRRAVLSHEGSHVARGDFYVLLLAALHRAIFWFNPFAWWLAHRLSKLAEIISDDAAVVALRDRPLYAGLLNDFANAAEPMPAAPALARPSTVRCRAERILTTTKLWRGLRWPRLIVTGASLMPLVAIFASTIVASSPPPSDVTRIATEDAVSSSDPETAPAGRVSAVREPDSSGERLIGNKPQSEIIAAGARDVEVATSRSAIEVTSPVARRDHGQSLSRLAWPRQIRLIGGGGRQRLDKVSGRIKVPTLPDKGSRHHRAQTIRKVAILPTHREHDGTHKPAHVGDSKSNWSYSRRGYALTCQGGNVGSCINHLTRLGLHQRYAGPRCSLSCMVMLRSTDRARGSSRAGTHHPAARRARAV
jgi:hypothetical protein